MHNRISYNQLASWLNREQSLNSSIEQTDLVNDYFDCLIAVSYTHLRAHET